MNITIILVNNVIMRMLRFACRSFSPMTMGLNGLDDRLIC